MSILSGSLEGRYHEPDQLCEVFPRLRGRIDCGYIRQATHTFTELIAEGQLLGTIGDWLDHRFQ